MTDKQLSAKQINILVKNGVKDPWNMPYQEAADKIGEIIAVMNKHKDDIPEVVKTGEPIKGGLYEQWHGKPSNGKEFHLSIEECRARALECALTMWKQGDDTRVMMTQANHFFNWIWKGE